MPGFVNTDGLKPTLKTGVGLVTGPCSQIKKWLPTLNSEFMDRTFIPWFYNFFFSTTVLRPELEAWVLAGSLGKPQKQDKRQQSQ